MRQESVTVLQDPPPTAPPAVLSAAMEKPSLVADVKPASPPAAPAASSDPKDKFYRHFQEAVTALQDEMDQLVRLRSIPSERQELNDRVLTGISRLDDEVADAADYVPAYDQRSYAQAIKALREKLNSTNAKVAPRSRFQFKARAAHTTTPPTEPKPSSRDPTQSAASSSAPSQPRRRSPPRVQFASPDSSQQRQKDYNAQIRLSSARIKRPSFSQSTVSICEQASVHVCVPLGAAAGAALVEKVERCVVDLSNAARAGFASLTVRSVAGSVVLGGRVSGSVHVTGMKGGVLVVRARQVRLHDCRDVDVYVWCAGRPIVEDCEGVRVAPVPAYFVEEGDEVENNMWDQVDDFNWLKDGPSPNWSVLPEERRISDATWEEMRREESPDVDGVLARLGVLKA